MDIQYLLMLQTLREGVLSFLAPAMEFVSDIIVSPASFGAAILIFWAVSKELGTWMLGASSFSNIFVSGTKATACVYRPWVRDSSVLPYGNAKAGATGYSFPSGHTEAATTLLAPISNFLYNAGKSTHKTYKKILAVLIFLCIFVVMFSRNFLGVHTPQDVIVSFVISIIGVFVFRAAMRWIKKGLECDKHNRDVIVFAVGLVLNIAFILYVNLKTYPLDYDASGTLLMDPKLMIKDSMKCAGFFMGFLLGWFFEQRFINSSTCGLSVRGRFCRVVVGLAIAGPTYLVCHILFKAYVPYVFVDACLYTVVLFVAMFVCPIVFVAIERRFEKLHVGENSHIVKNTTTATNVKSASTSDTDPASHTPKHGAK